MWKKTMIAVLTVLAMVIYIPLPHSGPGGVELKTFTTSYPNSDHTALWVRRNGSDPGFDYGGSNVSPSYGMSYFGTNVLQVHWSYNWTDIANVSLFPADSVLYIQTSYDSGFATSIADVALTDPRIMGAFIDDFQVGLQNASNMSAIYTNLHHNDGALGYNLTLGLIVYNRNYYVQSPNTWASIEPYFDAIHFWFYSDTYPLLYPEFCGYEDAFLDLHSWLPDKDYWLGIYLHWYNIGSYPFDFTYRQMAIASRLILEGYATHLSILENFWIQHNTPTALTVKNFINNELEADYTTTWDMASGNMTAPLEGFQTTGPRNYTFSSTHLLNVTAKNRTGDGYVLQNLRTGQDINTTVINATDMYFILEPQESYKLSSMPLTMLAITSRTYLTTNTSWNNRLVALSSVLNLNATLWVNNSIIRVSDYEYQNSMVNTTTPQYGIIFNGSDSCKVYLTNSTIEPELRIYPYYLNVTGVATNRVFSFKNSTLACYAGAFSPMGYVTVEDTLLFQVQPNGATYFVALWIEAPSRINDFRMIRSTIWNHEVSGSVGMFLMPSTLWGSGHFIMDDNLIAGGTFGLWIDMAYSTAIGITALKTYPTASPSTLFTEYWVQGTGNAGNGISIECNSTSWTMTELTTGPTVTFITTGLSSSMAYKAFKDGTSIALGDGPTLTFRNTGGGDFEVVAVYTKQISGVIQLTFIMFAIGVVVGVIAEGTKSLRKEKLPTTQEMVKSVLNMVIYIVIGMASLGIMYSMV